MYRKDGRQVITPLFTKFRTMLFCLDIFSCYILSANLTVSCLTVLMKVSFKKQMLQYQSMKYGNEIRMFMFLLVFVSEFAFHILKTYKLFSLSTIFVWIRSFPLQKFVKEIQQAIRPVLHAYIRCTELL
jgi:hypothetical protein